MENLDRLIFEPRMTGLVLIADPPTVEHLRFRLRLKKSPVKEVLFWDRRGLGNVSLLSDKEYQEKLTSAVAGVGNLYASEILHLAGVHPQARCNRLSKKRYQQIHQRMVEVLELAIEHEGSTLSDGTYRNALNDPGGYQNQHRVYECQRSTFFCKKCQKKR